jgi:hypothetical protein
MENRFVKEEKTFDLPQQCHLVGAPTTCLYLCILLTVLLFM